MYAVAQDDEITSDELDGLLDDADTLPVDGPAGSTELRLYVAVDSETLNELERRAIATGSAITDTAAEALRTGARA